MGLYRLIDHLSFLRDISRPTEEIFIFKTSFTLSVYHLNMLWVPAECENFSLGP